ncbi:hypothetical protein [Modestobacter marinus]|uniref:hypothetical protein n=1 Tax=Modestobacter marinus TaxID=477641 RepID=UPI001C98E148|nr:hypothetical protein [Modestobacter marinus]
MVAVGVVSLAGCGGEDEPRASADCEAVPAEVMTRIADGARDGTEFVAREAAAFRASDSEVYYVALRFGAAGGGDETGVWTTDSLAADVGVSTVLSVDGLGKQFTVWPDAEAAFDISPAHPSVGAAKDCLG